jgi:short-subunit dehydrogenase
MSAFVCITGASSGIGRALALSVPFDPCTLVTVNRRPAPRGEWIEADLADPSAWPDVSGRVCEILGARRHDRAVLLHFAGIGTPHANTAQADLDEYTDAVLLNSAAGPVLAKAFIANCRAGEVPVTVVLST